MKFCYEKGSMEDSARWRANTVPSPPCDRIHVQKSFEIFLEDNQSMLVQKKREKESKSHIVTWANPCWPGGLSSSFRLTVGPMLGELGVGTVTQRHLYSRAGDTQEPGFSIPGNQWDQMWNSLRNLKSMSKSGLESEFA